MLFSILRPVQIKKLLLIIIRTLEITRFQIIDVRKLSGKRRREEFTSVQQTECAISTRNI